MRECNTKSSYAFTNMRTKQPISFAGKRTPQKNSRKELMRVMKKFIAVMAVVFMFSGAVQAHAWTGYFTLDWDELSEYASNTWNDVSEYIGGWFSDDSPTISKDETLPEEIASGWGKLTDTLNDTLKLREKQETLPPSSWLPFREDQQTNGKKIDELLDRALVILSAGDAGNARTQAIMLRNRIAALRVELDNLRNEKINAPESSYMFWKTTKDKADKKISALESELASCENELKATSSRLATELRKIGLELTEAQTDILLNSVTGEDILQNTIIFDNVKAVVTKLEELSQNDTNTLEITRRYTGMYLVLNDLLIHTQEELIRKINGEYKPRLQEITAEAESVRKVAQKNSNDNSYTPAQRKSFALNAESNTATIEAAALYGELLDSQKLAIMDSISILRRNRDLAENTYKTVRSSGELRGLIHSGLSAFDAVSVLSMPELKIFENGAMRAEFDEINRRLKR